MTAQRTTDDLNAAPSASGVICPQDRVVLCQRDGVLGCPVCGRVYHRHGDDVIDVIGRSDYYWGEIDQDQMLRVLDYARRHGYQSAIDQLLGKEIDPAYRRSLNEPSRVDWRVLFGVGAEDTVLDVGSGWGRLGFALAPFVRQLCSLEYVAERLAFQQIMRSQRGDRNIHLVRASFLDMPFAAGTFDWVLFNGVFEWIGLAGSADPRKMQMDVLARTRAILKPGGQVFIGIENRWSASSLLGALDHSGLAYTNLMPRFAADAYVRLRKRQYRNTQQGGGYRTYTYGLYGYAQMLRQAGFKDIRIVAALSHYNRPRILIPVYPSAPCGPQMYVINEVLRRDSWKAAVFRTLGRLAVRARLAPLFYPFYLMVGRKRDEPATAPSDR